VKVPCKSREEPEISAGENVSDFSEDSRKSSGKLVNRWKILRPRHTIYRGGGVVSRTCLDSAVASFPEDACPLRRSEVTFFTRIRRFRGNGSSESTRFHEGLVLGNSVKPCHPRNVGLLIFMKQVRETAIGKRFIFMKKGWNEES
jgi:hypothetical protein